MAEQRFDINKFVRTQDRAIRKIVKKQDKDVKKLSNIKIKQLIKKEGRVPIPAKRKKEVIEKYNNKCAVCKKHFKTLQIHHKNGKNNDNRLSNLELLCPNHHYEKHAKGSKLNKTIRKRNIRKNSLLRF